MMQQSIDAPKPTEPPRFMPPVPRTRLNAQEDSIITAIDRFFDNRHLSGGRWFVEHCRGVRKLVVFLDYPLEDELDLLQLEAVAVQFDFAVQQLAERVLLVSKDEAVLHQFPESNI
jgi:hypothetical protein